MTCVTVMYNIMFNLLSKSNKENKRKIIIIKSIIHNSDILNKLTKHMKENNRPESSGSIISSFI